MGFVYNFLYNQPGLDNVLFCLSDRKITIFINYMIQEILAILVFSAAVSYALFNFVQLIIPLWNSKSPGGCNGCGGSCHLPSTKQKL